MASSADVGGVRRTDCDIRQARGRADQPRCGDVSCARWHIGGAARAAPPDASSVGLSPWTGSSGRPAASVACLSALATRLGRKLRMLREAALLVRHTLSTLAPGDRRERAILREAPLRAGNALPALAPGLCRQPPVLREAALLVRYRLATHARYLPLPLRVHRCEPTVRDAPFMNCSLSHHLLSLYARGPRDAGPATLIATCDAVLWSIPLAAGADKGWIAGCAVRLL